VDYAKYLGTIINKTEGIGKEEIRNRIDQSKKIISCLNSIWWDPHMRNDTKKYIGKILAESVLCYGCETWIINEQYKRIIYAVEMDYLCRSARVSRLEHIGNEEIRKRVDAEESEIERIQKRGLNWFGHVLRTGDERWPQQMYKWKPPGKRKRRSPKKSWLEGIITVMKNRGLTFEDAQDRQLWKMGTGRRHCAV
jgi:hypothetical protein